MSINYEARRTYDVLCKKCLYFIIEWNISCGKRTKLKKIVYIKRLENIIYDVNFIKMYF